MLTRSSRRLAIAALALAMLLAPALVEAKPPVPNRDAAEPAGGQEITDLGTDPTGRFTTTVVRYDGTKGINPGGLLGGTTGSSTAKDVYRCDFGPATLTRAGEGCRGINHASASASANAAQMVDVASYATSGGLLPVFVVGGPGALVSFWHYSSDAPRWTKTLEENVVNVSASPDGARLAVTTKGTTGPARLHVLDAADGRALWNVQLNNSAGSAADPTSLAFSRDGRVLVVGTTKGLLFADPYGARPSRTSDLSPVDTDGAVTRVLVSRNGGALVAGTTSGVYYVPLVGHRPAGPLWNRGIQGGATEAALSLDGERFAVAAGNRVLFYRHIGGTLVAEPLPDAYDAGAPVADLAYGATGGLLVAVAGDNVVGFGPHGATPLWTFKATDAVRGGLDGPLRKVTLSDGGERLVVAGRTKFLAYTNVVSATAAFAAGAPGQIVPARPVLLPMNVANSGSLPDNYTFVVKGPVGWTTGGPGNVALDPDGAATVNVSVEAPAGTAPGVYPVTVEVRSRASTDAVIATAQANLTLPRAVSLAVEVPEEKVTLKQGTDLPVLVTVRNLGNAEGVVNLSVSQQLTQGSSWEVRFARDQVRIGPGSSADVEMTLRAPSDSQSGVRNLVTIRAREGDVEATKALTAYVDPEFRAEITAANTSLEFRPGESRALSVTLRNAGNTEDTFNVTYTLSPALAAGDWKVTLAEDLKVTLAQGASRTLSVAIRPAVAEPRDATLTLHAVSQGSLASDENTAAVALTAIPAETTPEDEGGNLLPGPSPLLVLAAVGAALVLLRRGGLR